MTTADDISREIIKYCFEHDVLTQHGMAGIREKIAGVIRGADELHRLALVRIENLMDAKAGTPEGAELSDWADAVQTFERASD